LHDALPIFEVLGQYLEYRARYRVIVEHLPKAGWSTSIHRIVRMMIRPHAIPRRLEDLAPEDPETESDEHVNRVPLDLGDVLVLQPVGMDGTLWLHTNDGDIPEQCSRIPSLEGVGVDRKDLLLELAIRSIKDRTPRTDRPRESARLRRIVQ